MKNINTQLKLLFCILSFFNLLACADLGNNGYGYPPQPNYPNGGYRDPYYGGGYNNGGYNNNDYYRDRERDRIRNEQRELDRERDRLEAERQRLEDERNRPAARPPAPEPERCPSGFSPSENKCSVEERRRGCKDMRLPGGLGCVKR